MSMSSPYFPAPRAQGAAPTEFKFADPSGVEITVKVPASLPDGFKGDFVDDTNRVSLSVEIAPDGDSLEKEIAAYMKKHDVPRAMATAAVINNRPHLYHR